MNDVRRLLAIKANIETAMQRDLAPHIRVFAQQQLGEVCKAIEEAWEDLSKLFEPQELDQLKQRVAELEASNAVLLEENGKLRKINKELIGFLEKECRMCMFGGLNGCGACLLNEECERLDMIKKENRK